jgi:type VII secretion integral membrane protein EccD
VTGIGELSPIPVVPVAPEHVRVSVLGGRTQLDVALPIDIPVASFLPELVKLVRSRDSKTSETSSDTPWPTTRHTFWVLSRFDPATALQPNETLRSAGVVDGELLHLGEQRALSAPTLYDDVVDAAARLNKAAYAGWNATAARWMSFAGLAAAALALGYVVAVGRHQIAVVVMAAVVVAAMAGGAALAYRWYGQADVGAAVGWSTIPISAAIVWALLGGFGDYGLAAGCAVLVVVNAAWYWAIATGRWGYLASGTFFIGGGLAMLGHALGGSARAVGVVVAVVAALTCLAVSRLTGRLARVEPSAQSEPDDDASMFESPFAPQEAASTATTGSGMQDSSGLPGLTGPSDLSGATMPTAEAVWAQVRLAAITGSALYAGLGITVFCAVTVVLRADSHPHWAGLAFAGVCAATLGVYARLVGTTWERVSLAVPAVALVVAGCMSAQSGTTAMAWSGFGALLVVAMTASAIGLRVAGGHPPQRWTAILSYLQYAAFAALIPVALWVLGIYAQLEIG